jgi:hypothetical protein
MIGTATGAVLPLRTTGYRPSPWTGSTRRRTVLLYQTVKAKRPP